MIRPIGSVNERLPQGGRRPGRIEPRLRRVDHPRFLSGTIPGNVRPRTAINGIRFCLWPRPYDAARKHVHRPPRCRSWGRPRLAHEASPGLALPRSFPKGVDRHPSRALPPDCANGLRCSLFTHRTVYVTCAKLRTLESAAANELRRTRLHLGGLGTSNNDARRQDADFVQTHIGRAIRPG